MFDVVAIDLKQRLLGLQAAPPRYGKREGAWGFVRHQVYMQVRRALS